LSGNTADATGLISLRVLVLSALAI
jgi:hypothetical protein